MPPRGGTPEPLVGAEERPVVYCLVPYELADRLHDLLREHFAGEPEIEVIVERRSRERRAGADRRAAAEDAAHEGEERREVRAPGGRRLGERRAALAPLAEAPPLPRRARRYAERIAFVRRLEPSAQKLEDLDTARQVARFQAGDREAFSVLYSRYFERVYGYLRVALRDHHEAEDAAQEVFMHMLEALPRYERRRQPFRAWLFVLVRNEAIGRLRKLGRVEPEDPATIERRRDAAVEDERLSSVLDWITDRDVMIFVERLPLQSKQVIVMRYLMDMKSAEIAHILGTTPDQVRAQQRRALEFLRERLTAVREPKRIAPPKMQRWRKQDVVLRNRRFALVKNK